METRIIKLPTYGILINIVDNCGASIASTDLQGEEFNGILSLIMAHAVAGIDVESPAYLEGIETAVNATDNNS